MPSFTLTQDIAAPVSAVYTVFTDLAGAGQRIQAIKKIEVLTPGPFAVGTKFRETRVMFGREAVETMEITAVEPGKSYTVAAHSCGALFETTFRFEPKGQGTLVTMDFASKAESFFAKLFAPLASLMMGTMKKCMEQDMTDLKTCIEAEQKAARPSVPLTDYSTLKEPMPVPDFLKDK